MKKSIFAVLLMLSMGLPLAACGESAVSETPNTGQAPAGMYSGHGPSISSDTLFIRVNGCVLTATLAENSSTKALKALLAEGPLTIDMEDYASFEKVGELGLTLPRNDEAITTEPGDLILYLGKRFVIYYDTNTWNFTRLGKIRDVSQTELKAILGDGDVTVTLSRDTL